MSGKHQSRRDFLKASAVAAAAGSVPVWFSPTSARAFDFKNANDRPIIGCIGTGDRWSGRGGVGPNALEFGNCVAVCDVDANHAARGKQIVAEHQGRKGFDQQIEVHEDYRKILDRKDIEIVTIVTTDHWHSKIAIEALQAGKDVYCEKPLTLTILEGKQIRKVLDQTKQVFQVGTQQRSQFNIKEGEPSQNTGQLFLTALAMIRDGRIGDVKRATCDIGGSSKSGPLPKVPVPSGLNWEKWLGQAPLVDYISGPSEGRNYPPSRCHYEFRWWYEYSGGKMTDWGAHHVDIAQWALGMDNSGPVSVDPVHAVHPVPFEDGRPTVDNEYNAATEFTVVCKFANGGEIRIVHASPDGNGILFEGTKG
ncbi:MAG: Gfo/Idh/MocA family oxidoreductase, partial [Planctomycetaceae bacterium]